jgi:hypothetical protein
MGKTTHVHVVAVDVLCGLQRAETQRGRHILDDLNI